jgi:hypothetical protein
MIRIRRGVREAAETDFRSSSPAAAAAQFRLAADDMFSTSPSRDTIRGSSSPNGTRESGARPAHSGRHATAHSSSRFSRVFCGANVKPARGDARV